MRPRIEGVVWVDQLPPPNPGGFRVSLDIYKAIGPLTDAHECLRKILDLVYNLGLTVEGGDPRSFWKRIIFWLLNLIGLTFRKGPHVIVWQNGAYQIYVPLSDSFILIETWRDELYVKVIVDLCHFSQDNTAKCIEIARLIISFFQSTDPDNPTEIKWADTTHGP